MPIIQGATVGDEMCAGNCGRVAGPKGYCGVCMSVRFTVIDNSAQIREQEERREMTIKLLGWLGYAVIGFVGVMVLFSLNHAIFKEVVKALQMTDMELCLSIESHLLLEWWGMKHRVNP